MCPVTDLSAVEKNVPILSVEHLKKNFGEHEVLRDITFDVPQGDVVSIIGSSGSGKSTLLRCINFLEEPTDGRILFRGKNAETEWTRAQYHSKVGMVFQSFNLFNNMSVLKNCMTGQMKVLHRGRAESEEKALFYLEKVGMGPYRDARPGQLSGGQKQRVAIARALACDPKVLLCDEATSALDPQTTASILQLIQRLNREMGITVVMITHQMQVVKEACHRVAVMENGRVVEEGDVFSIFAHPQQEITRSFVDSTTNLNKVEDLLEEGAEITRLKPGEKLVRLSYQRGSAAEAIVSTVSRNFGVDVNILLGSLELIDGALLGGLVVVFSGQAAGIENALAYFREKNVGVEVIAHADPA